MLSSKTMLDGHGEESPYFQGWKENKKNAYDDVQNPTRIIQMGLAENQLSLALLETWLKNNQDAARLTNNGESVFWEPALFQDYHGLPAFKNALAEFMAKIRGNKVSFDPQKLVLMAGATLANETLVFCIVKHGDAFLLPTPYYPGYDRDLKWRTGVELVSMASKLQNLH